MSLELYEKYRDIDGYIDLNKAEKDGLFNASSLRTELRGSDRSIGLSEENASSALKGWFDFSTSDSVQKETFLVRTNMFRGDEQNYGDYAELIFEEYATQLGIRTPHYDLFKYNNEKGVLSQKLTMPSETMISLGENLASNKIEGVPINFVDNIITQTLRAQGKSTDEIEELKRNLREITLLDISALNEDRHLGNICMILDSETEEMSLGIYDNEISFLLANPINKFYSKEDVEIYANLSSSIIHGNRTEDPVETAKEILKSGDSDLLFFLEDAISTDILQIMKTVENRIKTKLPVKLKNIVNVAFKSRAAELGKVFKKTYNKIYQNDNIGGEDR